MDLIVVKRFRTAAILVRGEHGGSSELRRVQSLPHFLLSVVISVFSPFYVKWVRI